MVEQSHTGILATLRRDGVPIVLPIWFVVIDRRIYLRTAADSKKAGRIHHDPRASFLVESGQRWADLCSVHLTGRVARVDEQFLVSRIEELFEVKYAGYRTSASNMSEATRAHYASARAFFELIPDERILSWDNKRLGVT